MSEPIKLFYLGNREMNLTPDTVFHPRKAAEAIQNGKAFYVHLQPGDGTRYDFYIIPCLGQLCPLNYGLGPERIWIFLTPINLDRSCRGGEENFVDLRLDPLDMKYQVANAYKNEWTVQIVSHYLALVCREIEE